MATFATTLQDQVLHMTSTTVSFKQRADPPSSSPPTTTALGEESEFKTDDRATLCLRRLNRHRQILIIGAELVEELVIGTAVDERFHLGVRNAGAMSGSEYFLHRDLIGSTRLATDAAGSKAVRLDFDAYGREVLADDAI